MPNDVKFFIDKTQLKKDVGMAYVSVYNLIENNTLGLESGIKLIEEEPKVPIYYHKFTKPKI